MALWEVGNIDEMVAKRELLVPLSRSSNRGICVISGDDWKDDIAEDTAFDIGE